MTSLRQPWRSAKRVYMRARSPANRADSSPPVPARISMKALRASSGSLGSRAVCNWATRWSSSASAWAISSWAMARISASSLASANSSRAVSRSCWRCVWRRARSHTLLTSACSRESSRKRLLSAATTGSDKAMSSSCRRWARRSSEEAREGARAALTRGPRRSGAERAGAAGRWATQCRRAGTGATGRTRPGAGCGRRRCAVRPWRHAAFFASGGG
jgi:hypothetical protein